MSPEGLGLDSRRVATYDFDEASHYLHVPMSALRTWACGDNGVEPLIAAASNRSPMLSFINLIEIHMLSGISLVHKVKTQNIRAALNDKRNSHDPHPLASRALLTEDIELLARDLGEVGHRFKPTEQTLIDVISAYRKRIEWEDNEPAVLFPFPTANAVDGRKSVMIDPRISFGRLVISGTGIATEIVAERFHAGESIDDLAKDYRRDRLEIEDVLRFEPALAA